MDDAGLKIRFHNPNTEEETAKYILQIFAEVGMVKLDRVLQERGYQPQTYHQQVDSKKIAQK